MNKSQERFSDAVLKRKGETYGDLVIIEPVKMVGGVSKNNSTLCIYRWWCKRCGEREYTVSLNSVRSFRYTACVKCRKEEGRDKRARDAGLISSMAPRTLGDIDRKKEYMQCDFSFLSGRGYLGAGSSLITTLSRAGAAGVVRSRIGTVNGASARFYQGGDVIDFFTEMKQVERGIKLMQKKKFYQKLNSQSAIAQRVFAALSPSDYKSVDVVHRDLVKSNGGNVPDKRVVAGCLYSLAEQKLVINFKGMFKALMATNNDKHEKEEPVNIVENKVDVDATVAEKKTKVDPPAIKSPIEIMEPVRIKVQELEDAVETAALEMDEYVRELGVSAEKITQLKALLGSL